MDQNEDDYWWYKKYNNAAYLESILLRCLRRALLISKNVRGQYKRLMHSIKTSMLLSKLDMFPYHAASGIISTLKFELFMHRYREITLKRSTSFSCRVSRWIWCAIFTWRSLAYLTYLSSLLRSNYVATLDL